MPAGKAGFIPSFHGLGLGTGKQSGILPALVNQGLSEPWREEHGLILESASQPTLCLVEVRGNQPSRNNIKKNNPVNQHLGS